MNPLAIFPTEKRHLPVCADLLLCPPHSPVLYVNARAARNLQSPKIYDYYLTAVHAALLFFPPNATKDNERRSNTAFPYSCKLSSSTHFFLPIRRRMQTKQNTYIYSGKSTLSEQESHITCPCPCLISQASRDLTNKQLRSTLIHSETCPFYS